MNKKITREDLYEAHALNLLQKFEEIRQNVPHNLEVGQNIEEVLKEFLNIYLPKRFRAASGFIIDKKNKISTQQDVIIYDALNCPVYRYSDRAMIIPSDNCAAVIEVKSSLTTTTLADSINKISNTKSLEKTPLTNLDKEHELTQTYGLIFAFESKINPATVLDYWEKEAKKLKDFTTMPNTMIVLNESVYTTTTYIPNDGIGPCIFEKAPQNVPKGTKFGIGHVSSGKKSLDEMMRLLIPQLSFFRHRIDHPGFDFSRFGNPDIKWLKTKE